MFKGARVLLGIGLLSAVVVLGAACDDDEDGDDGAMADGDAVPLTAAVAGVENEIAGTVSLTADGGEVKVAVELGGVPEGAHANHLHHGSCASQGEVHVTLEESVANGDGDVEQETTFDDPPLEHFATGHYYAIHVGDNDTVGEVIACGDVVAA